MDRLQELVRLHRMGSGGREVARLLGMCPSVPGVVGRVPTLAAPLCTRGTLGSGRALV
jgi:hypothetical protein